MRQIVLVLILMLILMPLAIANGFWIRKQAVNIRPYNVKQEWFLEDHIYLETKYVLHNFTYENTTIYKYIPENVSGFIASVSDLPAIYIDYEVLYDPSDQHIGFAPTILSLYHADPRSSYVLTARVDYSRSVDTWSVCIFLTTYKVSIENQTMEYVDSEFVCFTQQMDRIQLFMYPQFYTYVENSSEYLIFGFHGSFKNDFEQHDFDIAYDKVLLTNRSTTFTDAIREKISAIGNWIVWIGLGVYEYIPEKSRLNTYGGDPSLQYIVEKMKIYGMRVENWVLDSETLFYAFVKGKLPFYNEPTLENIYNKSGLLITYLIPFFISIAIGVAIARIHESRFTGTVITLGCWLILGGLFFNYPIQLVVMIIFSTATLFMMKQAMKETVGERIHVEE